MNCFSFNFSVSYPNPLLLVVSSFILQMLFAWTRSLIPFFWLGKIRIPEI
jgi:hypothetical protein